MAYSVAHLARALNVSTNTIRNWGDEFAEYLSDDANPPGRMPRRYNDNDVSVLTTVAMLREQLQPYEDIHERLAAGDRLEPVEPFETQEESISTAEEPSTALAPMTLFEAFRAEFQDHIDTLKAQLEREQELHDATRAQLEQAQKRARELEERLYQEPPQNAPGSEKQALEREPGDDDEPRPWWQFWKS